MNYAYAEEIGFRGFDLGRAMVRSPKHEVPPDIRREAGTGEWISSPDLYLAAVLQAPSPVLARYLEADRGHWSHDLDLVSRRYDILKEKLEAVLGAAPRRQGKSLGRLSRLSVSSSLAERFRSKYNGKGIAWLSKWLLKTQISESEARALLAEVVEDGLISTFAFVSEGRPGAGRIRKEDMPILLNAFAARIPVARQEEQLEIGDALLRQLLHTVNESTSLRVDGGEVRRDGETLVAVVEADEAPMATIHMLSQRAANA